MISEARVLLQSLAVHSTCRHHTTTAGHPGILSDDGLLEHDWNDPFNTTMLPSTDFLGWRSWCLSSRL